MVVGILSCPSRGQGGNREAEGDAYDCKTWMLMLFCIHQHSPNLKNFNALGHGLQECKAYGGLYAVCSSTEDDEFGKEYNIFR